MAGAPEMVPSYHKPQQMGMPSESKTKMSMVWAEVRGMTVF